MYYLHYFLSALNQRCISSYVRSIYRELFSGHTHEAAYALHPAQEAYQDGWRVVVINARGLGGIPLRTPRTYNGANTEDVTHILKDIVQARYPNAKKIGCGFSLGG